MGDPAGYHWSIKACGGDWVWAVRNVRGEVVLSGSAITRPHAAACVIHALVEAMTVVEARALAA